MYILKNKIIKVFFTIFLLTTIFSCDEGGDPDAGGTAVVKMSGDWYVQTLVDGEVVIDYALISTYNTSKNDGKEMWIDDKGHIWVFKCKSPVDISSTSFAGDNLASSIEDDDPATTDIVETYDVNVNITEGKITKNGTTSTGGHTVDKISFKAEFSDDPGTIYEIVGYKRTGFLEDEH